MQRRTFLVTAAAATTAAVAAPARIAAKTVGRVLVIGAGAAGLTAAHHLRQAGVDVQVLEAAPIWGGRIAKLTSLSDFPIDAGAEWIHGPASLLGRILGRGDSDLGVETMDYRPRSYQNWHKDRLRTIAPETLDYAEVKFRNSTWYDFFDRFIARGLADRIILNAPVAELTYSTTGATARLADGRLFEADHVLVTVPLSLLQNGGIRFTPRRAGRVIAELNDITFGTGFKVFLRFKERFYPDVLIAGPLAAFKADSWTEKTYYDAAFGKGSRDHVLGLFTAAELPLARAKLSDAAMVSDVLAELDTIYDGAASPLFLQGHAQNWTKSPYIRGSYAMENNSGRDIAQILTPLEGRVHFAGEALGGDDQATVQGAAFSAQRAVARILRP